MLDAALFYEHEAPHLGVDFLAKIESAVADVRQNPERWPDIGSGVRRRLAHRFPYAVLYKIDPDEIVVLAVMHLHRHPGYWINRMSL